ncbi:MAG: phage/plasmid primase, P4 family [Xanthobacteraceae bacterium]
MTDDNDKKIDSDDARMGQALSSPSSIADAIEGAFDLSQSDDRDGRERPSVSPHPPGDGEQDFFSGDDSAGFGDDIPAPAMPPEERARISTDTIACCALEPQNDTGNGQRLLHYFGDRLLNVREQSAAREPGWHSWTGTHWSRDGGNEAATLFAQDVAPRIALEADFLTATPGEATAIKAGEDADWQLTAMEKTKADWKDDDKRKAMQLDIAIASGKAAAEQLEKRQLARRKFAVSSGNGSRVREMLNQALPHRTFSQEELDADPLAFNCANGTLRFECYDVPDLECPNPEAVRLKEFWIARLYPHDPADLISKLAPVDFGPDAKAPIFLQSIERFQPNATVRRWLQKYFGYALTGLNGEQCLLFNYGSGANWKSTFTEIVCRVMGDYAATLKFESLAGDSAATGAQASPDIARLPGARLVRASEPDRGNALKEGLIKSLTGGEPMLARHNFGNFFSFYPEFKLALSGNTKPEIGGVDHGIWRRIRFVIWPVTIEDSERREFDEVIAELWAECDGILAWLVDGALAYLSEGLAPPQEIIDATEQYREEMDIIGGFIRSCVERIAPAEGASDAPYVAAQAMFEAFEAWCGANGHRAWKQKAFGQALSQKGFIKDRKSTMRRYLWVKLHDVPARATRRDEPPHPTDADEEIPA